MIKLISFLPELYPGELLYSWFARYHLYSGNVSFKNTTYDLFGNHSHIATPDLSTELLSLHKRTSHFSPPNPKEWINKHTFYNYYTAFSPKQLKKEVINAMLNGNHKALHMKTGIMASTIQENKYFRYCPKCVSDNFTLYGEPYLHTLHQLPSCFICPTHNEILCDSDIPFRGYNKHEYIPFRIANCSGNRAVEIQDEKVFNTLLLIAKESEYLISTEFNFDLEDIQEKYKILLSNKGLLSLNGNIRQQDLSTMFYNFYGGEVLNLLQSSIDIDNQTCWLKTITRKHRKTFHPIRHILLILFLGESLHSLKTINIENPIKPFGIGAFPCLNIASEHYKQKIINNVEISISKTNLLIGTFECNCGFIYTRRGPDPERKELYNISRVKQFGDIWLSKLKQLINENRYSYREIAKRLNADTNTIIKYSKSIPSVLDLNNPNPKSLKPNYRKQWRLLMKQNQTLTKTELRKKAPNIFAWLYRNDRNWLDVNSPEPKKGGNKHRRVNWKKRDNELSLEMIPIIVDLFNQSKPIRVTKSTIGKRLNKLSLIEKNINKLPKVQFIFSEVAETIEEFQKRRIIWAAEQLIRKGEPMKAWRIKKIAGLNSNLSPVIERAIQTTLMENNY